MGLAPFHWTSVEQCHFSRDFSARLILLGISRLCFHLCVTVEISSKSRNSRNSRSKARCRSSLVIYFHNITNGAWFAVFSKQKSSRTWQRAETGSAGASGEGKMRRLSLRNR